MRRSLAPSQLAKRNKSKENHQPSNWNSGGFNSKDDIIHSQKFISPYRKPLNLLSHEEKTRSDFKENSFHAFPDHASHENYIKRLLSKPFKIPIPNYKGALGAKGLGVKRQLLRKPLHDPFEENALVLYAPPDISVHDTMQLDKSKIPVHVVVDPVLSMVSKILL